MFWLRSEALFAFPSEQFLLSPSDWKWLWVGGVIRASGNFEECKVRVAKTENVMVLREMEPRARLWKQIFKLTVFT